MTIEGKNILVLGGGGMVGQAVCRQLLPHRPASLLLASRRKSKARRAVEQLLTEFPDTPTRIVALAGDIFIRAEWQEDGATARAAVLGDPRKRRRLIADIIDPLDEEIINSSLLTRFILGTAPGEEGTSAQIVIDCMNTATAVSYQDLYASAHRLAQLAQANESQSDWPAEVEGLLASLYVPQLVRHIQLLYEAMRRVGTEAYIKVGTSGTGGMGFNIPFTHGEEKPSRLLLSKAALAGAQSLLTFLMARTPDGPPIVKEIKPTALIGWEAIRHGPIRRSDRDFVLYDCPPEQAVCVDEPASLAAEGKFGVASGQLMEGVFIDTGENGKFSAAEFSVITAPGLMQLVTPEEVACNVVRELLGGTSGREVIAALDGAVTGPAYRGGHLRQAALERLRQLEAEHGEAVAFGILGPPRLSKLLFEAHLLKRACQSMAEVFDTAPEVLAAALEHEVTADAAMRQRIISIGIPILLADGGHLLRGPVIKSEDAHHGWVDLTPANMRHWQQRLQAIVELLRAEVDSDSSSRHDRLFSVSRDWRSDEVLPPIGEMVAWIFVYEDKGGRDKA